MKSNLAILKKSQELARKMEEQTLYDYEMSGYMKTSDHRKIFRESARHTAKPKNKHIYIDQESSGRLMIQSEPDARKNRAVYPVGSVFSIKAYGQKNRYLGDINKVLKEQEENTEHWKKQVMERARKNAMKR